MEKESWLEYIFGICKPDARIGKKGSRSAPPPRLPPDAPSHQQTLGFAVAASGTCPACAPLRRASSEPMESATRGASVR